MLNRVDIMTDLETLGNNENVQIIQFSAKTFDITKQSYIGIEFNEYVDINNSTNLTVDGGTLKWWLKTDANLLASIINNELAVGEKTVLKRFVEFVKSFDCPKENIFLWGNGILFDNRIIKESMNKNYIPYPIFYRNDRDVRTILELASMKSGLTNKEIYDKIENKGTIHNAIDDVNFQIDLVRYCYDILMK